MSTHMKRLAAPRTLKLHRKEHIWTIRSSSGPHPIEQSIPLGLLIRDYLELCDTYKEAKSIVSSGGILVDGKPRKTYKYPCGFMDVVSIPKLKKDYRILLDRKGKLTLLPIESKDAAWKLCRIENKTTIKGKKTQLNLHDGQNALVIKDEYSTGDVLKMSLKDKKISDVYKFDKGSVSMIIGGSHSGEIANIVDIEIVKLSQPNLVKMKGEHEFSTITKYVFPIGKTKPVILLPEVNM